MYLACLIIFAVQLLATLVISIISKNKAKLAKVTMITKLVQIPYYILFFIISVLGVMSMLGLMGVGLLFIPVFIVIDLGVFLTTIIPAEACSIRLIKEDRISIPKFLLYLFGNCVYVVDIVLSIMIHRDFKKNIDNTAS